MKSTPSSVSHAQCTVLKANPLVSDLTESQIAASPRKYSTAVCSHGTLQPESVQLGAAFIVEACTGCARQ